MKNYKVIVAYRGTHYFGWQAQPKQKTVQGEVTKVISRYVKEDISIHASGRTDQGVHALGQVFSFKGTLTIPVEKALFIMNNQLPEDIVFTCFEMMPDDFHARYSAIGKRYRYRLSTKDLRDPLQAGLVYHYKYKVDIAKMREAANLFIGEHDFVNFRATGSSAKTTVRRIDEFSIIKKNDEIIFETCGNGYLYNMVRIMVGALLEVGQGRESIEYIADALSGKRQERIPKTAPADGLYLIEVFYGKSIDN